MGPVIKCFVIPSNKKIKKNCEKKIGLLDAGWNNKTAAVSRCMTNLIKCESQVQVVVLLGSSEFCLLWEVREF